MAGSDKIYGTQEQYLQLKKWLELNEMSIRVMGDVIDIDIFPSDYLYDEHLNEFDENGIREIINTVPEVFDWLQINCPFTFVQEQITRDWYEDGDFKYAHIALKDCCSFLHTKSIDELSESERDYAIKFIWACGSVYDQFYKQIKDRY